MSGLVINGRFMAARPTGVQRVAYELVRQLGRHREELGDLFGAPPRILAPRGVDYAVNPSSLLLDCDSWLRGHAWEQIELPLRARGAVLLSLCNLSPVLAVRAGVECVTMFHDAQVFTSPASYSAAFGAAYRWAQPRIGAQARRILTVSHFSAGQLAQFGMAPAERIRVIHNGIDHAGKMMADRAILSRLGLEHGGYVLALASAQAHKNIDVLLRAFADGGCGGVKLVLFGAGGAEDFPAAGPDVVFAGRVSDGELAALMGDALCFAMPSTTEGFGLPPLEAMAQGCPAVIAPCGALPEVCGDAALQAAPDDPAAWRGAFALLHEDAALRARLVQRGLAQAGQFTWVRAGDALMAVLREVAAER